MQEEAGRQAGTYLAVDQVILHPHVRGPTSIHRVIADVIVDPHIRQIQRFLDMDGIALRHPWSSRQVADVADLSVAG